MQEYEVYVDSLFLINFCMNLLCLKLVSLKLPEGRKEVGQTAFGSSPRNGNLPFFISSAWRGRLEDGPWWDPVRLRHAFYGISHQESGGLCENGGEASSLFHGP